MITVFLLLLSPTIVVHVFPPCPLGDISYKFIKVPCRHRCALNVANLCLSLHGGGGAAVPFLYPRRRFELAISLIPSTNAVHINAIVALSVDRAVLLVIRPS